MKVMITLTYDDVGNNVINQLKSAGKNLKHFDAPFGWELIEYAIADSSAIAVAAPCMIDELSSKKADEIISHYSPDAVLMVSYHQGNESKSLILRGSGEDMQHISPSNPDLMRFLASQMLNISAAYGVNAYFEATHGYHLNCPLDFSILEIGGCEADWNEPQLGKAICDIIHAIPSYNTENSHLKGAVAFGRSHCSKTVLKLCAENGITHYFSERNTVRLCSKRIYEILSMCGNIDRVYIQKRMDREVTEMIEQAATAAHLEIYYFR